MTNFITFSPEKSHEAFKIEIKNLIMCINITIADFKRYMLVIYDYMRLLKHRVGGEHFRPADGTFMIL